MVSNSLNVETILTVQYLNNLLFCNKHYKESSLFKVPFAWRPIKQFQTVFIYRTTLKEAYGLKSHLLYMYIALNISSMFLVKLDIKICYLE